MSAALGRAAAAAGGGEPEDSSSPVAVPSRHAPPSPTSAGAPSSNGAESARVRELAAAALKDAEKNSGTLATSDSPPAFKEDEFAELCEFFAWGFFGMLPEKGGGGELTAREQQMLGRLYSKALLPLVNASGQNAMIALAFATTGEVLIKRAIVFRSAQRLVQKANEAQRSAVES